MKKTINTILLLLVIGLLYICIQSIMSPIRFNNEKESREKAVKIRLVQIRKAEEEFKLQNGYYCGTLNELIKFVNSTKVNKIIKKGNLTEKQISNGLTESSAAAIVNSGNISEICKYGLQGFKRDTVKVSMKESFYGKGFHVDSLKYIPFGNGEKFEVQVTSNMTKSGAVQYLMECGATYSQYLKGLDKDEINELMDNAGKSGAYPGLKIGDIITPNNNAGNWE